MIPDEQQEQEPVSAPDPLAPSQNALLQISRWTRQVAVIGFGIGAFIVMIMLFNGVQLLTAVVSSLPGGAGNMYSMLVAVFFVLFFLAALVLFYLFKASQLLFSGVQQKNKEMLSQAFRYLKSFFIVVIVFAALRLAGNLVNLL